MKKIHALIVPIIMILFLSCDSDLFNRVLSSKSPNNPESSNHPNNYYLYTANRGGNSVSGFLIDKSTGSLTNISGSPWDAGTSTECVAVDPAGRFLYTANWGSNNVSGYIINPSSGELSVIQGSPWFCYVNPRSITVDNSGNHVYVVNYYLGESAGKVAGYIINPDTGALSEISGSPWDTGGQPSSAAAHPAHDYLYVSNNFDENVSGYSINPSTGVLTPMSGSPFSIGCNLSSSVVSSDGRFLFVTRYNCAQVWGFNIDADDGALSTITDGIGTTGPSGSGPYALAEHPEGNFLYAANLALNTIAGFIINSLTGTLTSILDSPWALDLPIGDGPVALAIDPSGSYLYVAVYNHSCLLGYNINQETGELTALMTSPWSTGTNPVSITITGIE